MLEWIKNNKKLIGIIGTILVILAGSIFGLNFIKYNEKRDYLSIGTRQEDGEAISFAREEKKNPEKIEAIRELLDKGKVSELTDESAGAMQGEELIFDISYGKYMDTTPQIMVEMWIQEDGTAIYREALTQKYYTLDKASTQQLKKILK